MAIKAMGVLAATSVLAFATIATAQDFAPPTPAPAPAPAPAGGDAEPPPPPAPYDWPGAGRQPQDPAATCDATSQSSCACEAGMCCKSAYDFYTIDNSYQCEVCTSGTVGLNPACDPCATEVAACSGPVTDSMDPSMIITPGSACWDILDLLNPHCAATTQDPGVSCSMVQTSEMVESMGLWMPSIANTGTCEDPMVMDTGVCAFTDPATDAAFGEACQADADCSALMTCRCQADNRGIAWDPTLSGAEGLVEYSTGRITRYPSDSTCLPPPDPATCGDADGEGDGTAAVTDDDCGAGFAYDTSASDAVCAGSTCDVSGTPADKTACCVELPGCGDTPALTGKTGCDASCTGLTYVVPASKCTACASDLTTPITDEVRAEATPAGSFVLCDGSTPPPPPPPPPPTSTSGAAMQAAAAPAAVLLFGAALAAVAVH
jgi:hypothetical protein